MVRGSKLDCLQCGTGMSQRKEHGVTIDYCPECGGVWLDPGELEALTDGHHKRHVDVDDVFEDDEEVEEEEEDGLLGTIASALGGDEEGWDEEGEFEEDEEWGGEEEFGGEEFGGEEF